MSLHRFTDFGMGVVGVMGSDDRCIVEDDPHVCRSMKITTNKNWFSLGL